MSNKKLQTADLFLTNRGASSYTSQYGDIKENVLDSHIIQSPTPPTLITYPDLTVGTIWVDTSAIPKIWVWDGSIWEEIEGEPPVVDPDPGEVTFEPAVSGSGTQLDPYVLASVTSYTKGGTVESTETLTIKNQAPSISFPIQTLSGGASFSQPSGMTDANGDWSGKLTYTDTIQADKGATYEAELKIGVTSVYIKWSVVQVANKTEFVGGDGSTSAPNASPRDVNDRGENLFGTGTAYWADNAGTLRVADSGLGDTYTSSLVFGVNGAMDNSNKTVSDSDEVTVAFEEVDVNAAANGDTISGALTNDDGYFQVFSLIKDGNGAAIGFDDLVDQALSTEVESNVVHGSGHNVPVQLDVVVSTLVDVEASIDGGAWSAVFPVTVNPGDTVQVKGTTGADPNTAYTAEFTYGGAATTWSVTTVDIEATIVQPSITSPVDGASDLVPDITLSSSAYTEGDPAAPPGPHTTSTWEVYEADFLDYTTTDKITDVTGDVLTLETDAKLASLVAGDTVIMSDADGNAVDYTLETSTITTITENDPNPISDFQITNDFDDFTDEEFAKSFDGDLNTWPKFNAADGSVTLENTTTFATPYPLPPNAVVTVVTRNTFGGNGTIWKSHITINGDTSNTSFPPGNDTSIGGLYFHSFPAGAYSQIETVHYQDKSGATRLSTEEALRSWRPSDYSFNAIMVNGVPIPNKEAPGFVDDPIRAYNITNNEFTETELELSFDTDFQTKPSHGINALNNTTTFGTPYPLAPNAIVTVVTLNSFGGNGTLWKPHITINGDTSNTSWPPTDDTSIGGRHFHTFPAGAYDEIRTIKYEAKSGSGGTFTVPETRWAPNEDSFCAVLVDGVVIGGDASQISSPSTEFEFTSPNPDLKYFKAGDVVQGTDVTVLSVDTDNNKMEVSGGTWNAGDTVEFGPVTGGGEVVSVSGTAMTVGNVSGRWIGSDAENKDGEAFYVTDTERESLPGAPTTEPPASATYTSVTPSAETLTTATLTASELNTDKVYYSRVKYADDSSTGSLIESEFSPYSEFVTASVFAPDPGELWTEEGGVLIGVVNGHYLILGPKATEQRIPYQQSAPWGIGNGARNTDTGWYVPSTCTITDNEPLFKYTFLDSSGPNKGTWDADDTLGTGLNGHNDWFVPSQREWEFIGRYLQDRGWNGSSGTAADMPLPTDYKLKLDKYWCSNEDGTNGEAYNYNIGALQYTPLGRRSRSAPQELRVVRRVPT